MSRSSKKIVLIIVNDFRWFFSHRLAIANNALRLGYEVHVAGPSDCYPSIDDFDFFVHPLRLRRGYSGIWLEVRAFLGLWLLIRRLQPDILHLVTVKPVIYGGIVARLSKTPAVVSAIAGLGSTQLVGGFKSKIFQVALQRLYRFALNHANQCVVIQNPEDRVFLSSFAELNSDKVVMVPGSGVDLIEFSPTEERPGLPIIIFAARLIAQKGVKEFVEAARLIHLRGVRARFWLAGQPDRFNPSSVSAGDVNKWDKENDVEVVGQISDVAAIYAQAHLVVLPSYYGEGVPKSLLEAAACGRAIVTTDHPGCRDAIRHNETGLLVPVRDSVALANAIQYLIENPFRRREMGYAARRLAEREFAVERVVEAHTRAYEALLENSCG